MPFFHSQWWFELIWQVIQSIFHKLQNRDGYFYLFPGGTMGTGIGPDQTIRVGMIGTGTISRSHARCLADCSNVELVACCDVIPEAVNRFADEFDQPRSILAHDTISTGILGDIYRARLVQLRRRGRPGFDMLKDSKWFLDHAQSGGGVIADMGQYFLDQMMWYLGWPKVVSVSANVTHNKIEPVVPPHIKDDVEEHFDADIRLEGGTTLSLEVTWLTHMEGANGIWLYGTEAGLKLGNGVTLYHDMHGGPVETEIPLPRRADESNVTRDFIEALREGREPVTTADQGVVISKIVDAIYKSSETKGEVRF
jgi:predicted dehydrogenase